MKHTIMNNLKSFFAASLLLLLLASCNNTAADNSKNEQVTLNGKISIQGYENILPSHLLAGLNNKSEVRSITTKFDAAQDSFDGSFYYLLKTEESNPYGNVSEPKKYEKKLSLEDDEFDFVLDSTIAKWNLSLDFVYKEAPKNNDVAKSILVMTSAVISKDLTDLTSENPEPINFVLYPVNEYEEPEYISFAGKLELSIEDATGSDGQEGYLSYVKIKNNSNSSESTPVPNNYGLESFVDPCILPKASSGNFEISLLKVLPGNYDLEFSFYKNGIDNPVYSFTEAVSVYPFFITNTILNKSGLHVQNKAGGGYTIKINDELVQNYKQKEQKVSDTGTMLYSTKEENYSSTTTYFYTDTDDNSFQYNDAIDYTFDSEGYVYILHSDGKTITSDNPSYKSLTIVPTELKEGETFTKATGIEMDTASDTLYAYNNERKGKLDALYSPLELFADEYYLTVCTDVIESYSVVENIAVYDGTIYPLFHGSDYPYAYKLVAINSINSTITNNAVIKKADNDPDSGVEYDSNVLNAFGFEQNLGSKPLPQITDMIYMDGALYFIVQQYGVNLGSGYTGFGSGYIPGIFSRGALVRVSSLTSKYPDITVLGWTDTKEIDGAEPTELTFGENENYKYGLCTGSYEEFKIKDDPDIEVIEGQGNNLKAAGKNLYYTEGQILSAYANLGIELSSAAIYTPQTLESDFAAALFYGSSSGFYGPQKFVALKPKKLIIADDGLAVYVDVDNFWCYKNVNRVVTVDLEEFAITDAAEVDAAFANNRVGAIPLVGSASGYGDFPFAYSDNGDKIMTFPTELITTYDSSGYPLVSFDSSGYPLESPIFYLTLIDEDSIE